MFNFNKNLDDENVENYPFIVNEILNYIKYIKEEELDNTSTLVDIIMDYCHKRNFAHEFVGDAIRSDFYFSQFIQNDCVYHNIIRDDTHKNCSDDDW